LGTTRTAASILGRQASHEARAEQPAFCHRMHAVCGPRPMRRRSIERLRCGTRQGPRQTNPASRRPKASPDGWLRSTKAGSDRSAISQEPPRGTGRRRQTSSGRHGRRRAGDAADEAGEGGRCSPSARRKRPEESAAARGSASRRQKQQKMEGPNSGRRDALERKLQPPPGQARAF
jgi:hypothetical protein